MRCPTCGRFVAMGEYADHVDGHEVETDVTEPIEATAQLVEPGGAVPSPPRRPRPRRRRWPLVLLPIAGVAAFVGVYFALRAGDSDNRVAASKVTSTSSTSVSATFAAGPPATQPPEATTVPASTVPPEPDPRAQIKFLNGSFQCPGDGSLTVQGTVSNDGPGVYSIRFTVFILDGAGNPIDSATGAADHLAAGERRAYTATGTCDRPIAGGFRGRAQVDSITPG